MSDYSSHPGPEPAAPPISLRVAAAPHRVAAESFNQITAAFLGAAMLPLMAGAAAYGLGVFRVVAVCLVVSVGAEWSIHRATGRGGRASLVHAALIGVLVALMMPPQVAWAVPALASLSAVVIGKSVVGGLGHYSWHPALVGWALAQLFFAEALAPARWPMLGVGRLFRGSIGAARAPEMYTGWRELGEPVGHDAWLVARPADMLGWVGHHPSHAPAAQPDSLTALVRDHLPPWEDTVLGLTGGGIGEGAAGILVLAGLFLIYRRYVRWVLPAGMLGAAALAAAVLPVLYPGADAASPAVWRWLPVAIVEEGLPVGAVYVLYHLTSGSLMLGAVLIATDVVASPLTTRGQLWFGAAIGGLTIVLRLYGVTAGACYWAILIMNTFVPLIDARAKRRVVGT